MQDQWDAQNQAQVCSRACLYIYSDGLSDQEVRQVFGIPCHDIEKDVGVMLDHYGPDAKVAVLPAGPLTVPYLQSEDK